MSFDLGVLSAAEALDADAARNAYHRLASGVAWHEVLKEDPRVAQFATAFTERWPDSVELEASPAHLILSIPGSAPDEIVNFCESTAMRLGLYLFDPQDETLYSRGDRPRKATPLPKKALICEACGKPIAPVEPHAESPRLLHMECLFREFS